MAKQVIQEFDKDSDETLHNFAAGNIFSDS